MRESQLDLAKRFGEKVNHTSASVRWSFTDADDEGRSPLASIMRGGRGNGGGGRGGGTRLAVLLTLLWALRGGNHDSDRPARFWAELIGLDDPQGAGARIVRDSYRELATRGFLSVDAGIHGQPLIQLLREDGSGKPYSSPVASERGQHVPEPYFRIPAALWERGLIRRLSGPGLAMYVIVMRTVRTDHENNKVWFSPTTFKDKFALGDSSRKAGLRELVEQGVLIEQWESVDSTGGTEYRTRRRKTYTIEDVYAPTRA